MILSNGEIKLGIMDVVMGLRNGDHVPQSTVVTMEVIANTDDEKILFTMATKGKTEEEQLKAIEKIHDQSLLCQIIARNSNGNVQFKVLEKLSDKEELIRVMTTASDIGIRFLAALKLDGILEKESK